MLAPHLRNCNASNRTRAVLRILARLPIWWGAANSCPQWVGRKPKPPRRGRLGRRVDPELAELAVEGRAADPEATRDFGHPPAVVADGEADDVRLDLFEGP